MRTFPVLKILCIVPLFALMAPTSGGLPSRPTFQAVTVNGTATAAAANVTGTATAGTLAATTANVSGTATAGALSVTGASALTGTLTAGSTATVAQGIQVKGSGVTGFVGAGTEIYNSAGTGGVQSYNRTGATFQPINIIGSTVGIAYGQSAAHALDVSSNGNITVNAPVTGNAIIVNGAGTSAALRTLVVNAPNTVGTSSALLVQGGTNSADRVVDFGDALGTTALIIDGARSIYTGGQAAKGAGTINAAALYQAGLVVPRASYAVCAGTGGFGAGIQSSNVTSCVRNSIGNYTVTFSSAYTTNSPVCNVSLLTNAGFTWGNASTINVGVITNTAALALADISFSVNCNGT